MGMFDKIKDAIQDATDGVDEDKKVERKPEPPKKDQTLGDALKDKLDDAKKESKEAADKADDKVKQGKAKVDKPSGGGGGGETYTVKSGDTLSAIGAKYGVSYMDLAKASGIDNPDLIFPGQVLTIPGK